MKLGDRKKWTSKKDTKHNRVVQRGEAIAIWVSVPKPKEIGFSIGRIMICSIEARPREKSGNLSKGRGGCAFACDWQRGTLSVKWGFSVVVAALGVAIKAYTDLKLRSTAGIIVKSPPLGSKAAHSCTQRKEKKGSEKRISGRPWVKELNERHDTLRESRSLKRNQYR